MTERRYSRSSFVNFESKFCSNAALYEAQEIVNRWPYKPDPIVTMERAKARSRMRPDGLSMREIARRLDVNESTVHRDYKSALVKCRAYLERNYPQLVEDGLGDPERLLESLRGERFNKAKEGVA